MCITIPIAKVWDTYEELVVKAIIRKPRTDKPHGTRLYYTVECQLCWKVFDIRKYDWWKTKRCGNCAKRRVNQEVAFENNRQYLWKRFWHLTVISLKPSLRSHGTRCDVICECWHISEKNLNYVVNGQIDYCWRFSNCNIKYPNWLKNIAKKKYNYDYRDIIWNRLWCITIRRYTWYGSYICRCDCWALFKLKRNVLTWWHIHKYCKMCRKKYFSNNKF